RWFDEENPVVNSPSTPPALCTQGSGAYYGSRAGGISVHADRNEIVFDGVGSTPPALCTQGSGAYYGSRAGGISVHADRNEIVFDGVGDCRSPAVGKRDRCAVRAQHGKKVDALWRGL